jgi:protein phosphatase
VACIAAGGWIASRAVYFVGTDEAGFVAVYRGLPYDGPLGLPLYDRVYVSGVPAAEIPAQRRGAVLNHELRSRDDARDLVRKLELGQVHP